MKKILIIPDVHGRTFWKEAIEKNDYEKVIFLGDYLDPYKKIPVEDTFNNFKEIVSLKENNPDKVILLIGNHDRHYMKECKSVWSRYSREMREKLDSSNFEFDDKRFKIAHEETINGRRFVFSHAGIHKKWLKELCGFEDIDIDQLNLLFFDNKNGFDFDFYISFYRGGYYDYGSIIWADIREYALGTEFEGVTQIFGHTQLYDHPVNLDNEFYCLDVRRPFYINENGEVCEMDGTIIKNTKVNV